MSVGYLFKISAAPFHFWSPDVYDAVPTRVTVFLTVFPKIPILIFLLGVFYPLGLFSASNLNILLVSSFLSLIVGTVTGLAQIRLKRLLAFSTISHVGFLLLALAIMSIESYQTFLFYLAQYSLSSINVFFIVIAIGYFLLECTRKNKDMIEKDNSPVQLISQLKGFYHINPLLTVSFAITLFSLMGIPPLIGFFAKQMVLSAALERGYIFLSLIAIFTSVIGAVYYLGVIKSMIFDKNEDEKIIQSKVLPKLDLSSSICGVISVLTLIILLFISELNLKL